MLEGRRRLLVRMRQRHPGLDAVHGEARALHLVLGALAVGDAASGGHPVDVARPDRLRIAQAVAMEDAALEQVGDGRQPDMRMRPHRHAVAARRHGHRPEMVEEDERPDHAPLHARQHAAHGEARSQFVGAALDQKLDRIGHLVLPRAGYGAQVAPVNPVRRSFVGYAAMVSIGSFLHYPALQHADPENAGAHCSFPRPFPNLFLENANSPVFSMACGTVAFLPLFVGLPELSGQYSGKGRLRGAPAGRAGRSLLASECVAGNTGRG